MEKQELEGGLEVLEADLAETENSVYHLVRSNVELSQFLDGTPGDKDLEQALDENKLVLVKKRHRVNALRNAVSDLKTQRRHVAVAVPSSPAPLAASGGGLVDAESGGLGPGRPGSVGRGIGSQSIAASSDAGVGDMINTMASSMSLDTASSMLSPAGRVAPASKSQAANDVCDASSAAVATSDPTAAGQGQGAGGRDLGDGVGGGVLL